MKKFKWIIILLIPAWLNGQMIINANAPLPGFTTLSSLWNFTVANNYNTKKVIKVQLMICSVESQSPILIGSSDFIDVEKGLSQIKYLQVNPTYNFNDPNFNIDIHGESFIPSGKFKIFYKYYILNYDNPVKISEQCNLIEIPPISPPILLMPKNNENIVNPNFTFSWLPPTIINGSSNLVYDLNLVKVENGQSISEAINRNFKLTELKNLHGITYQLGPGSIFLSEGDRYAWQIIAKKGEDEIAKSEIWIFKFGSKERTISQTDDALYIKLTKSINSNYNLFTNTIKIDYFNETSDTICKILIEDLTNKSHNNFLIGEQKVVQGSNLLKIDASNDSRFISGHTYLLEIVNSRNQLWELKFSYKKINS